MKNTCLLSQDAKTYLCCFYQTLDGMVQGMTTAGLTQSISHNFAVQMIPHHRAAVQMSNNVLRFTDSKAVRRLAQHLGVSLTTVEKAYGLLTAEGYLESYPRSGCRVAPSLTAIPAPARPAAPPPPGNMDRSPAPNHRTLLVHRRPS